MIRLLIVDDSPLMRRLMTGIFSAEGDFEIDVARDGAEAIGKLASFQPDVVTLDINMPGMDGISCLDRIMVERPCPVVMLSSLTTAGAEETIEALALGAVDFIAKPRGPISIEIETLAPALVAKIRAASQARISRTTRLADRIRFRTTAPAATAASATSATGGRLTAQRIQPLRAPKGDGVVLVGTSTGGPSALDQLLKPLPATFPWPILIAQHMPASFTGALARRLDGICALTVQEVTAPVRIEPGHVYIGRGDADLIVSRRTGGLVAMPAPSSTEVFWHPSVDRLVETAMRQIAPERLIGVLMTGMGNDGARSMTELAAAGGITIAESRDTAVIWGMPGALVAAGGAGDVLPLDRIAARLTSLLGR